MLETIRVEQGMMHNVALHNERLRRTREDLFNLRDQWDVRALIQIPDSCTRYAGRLKCRMLYDRENVRSEFIPYKIKPIRRLYLVRADHVKYPYKYADRTALEDLKSRCGKDEDIIMVCDGLLTDFSYGNLVLRIGSRNYTPDAPMLRGTKRAQLLTEGKIEATPIRVEALHEFDECCLINSMLDPGEITVPVEHILNAL